MITQYLSDKLRVMSLLAIILVLYIHSGFHDYPNEIQRMTFNFLLQDFVSGMKGRCAVPLFYVISGYLFFANVDFANDSLLPILKKIKKRVRSLVIPFLIAAWFPAFFYLVLEYIPGISGFLNSGGFSQNFSKPLPELIYFMYWDAGGGSPYAFHLWFLRDLIIIVAFTPLIFHVLKSRLGGNTFEHSILT